MKRFLEFVILTLFVLFWSCGGGSEEKKTAEKPEKEESKPLSLKTKEGMMQRLQELDINVPDELIFIESSRKSGNYTAIFEAKNVDDVLKKKLEDWYQKIIADKAEIGWKKQAIRENEEMIGSIYNQYILLRPAKSGIGFSGGIDITSVYNPDQKVYKLYVQPD